MPALFVGAVLVLFGCVLLGFGVLGLGTSFAVFPRPRARAALVTTGVYARARHPIFGGWILVGLGFGVAFSPWALPISLALVAVLWGKSLVEERLLEREYPAYAQYRSQVRHRFFPLEAPTPK